MAEENTHREMPKTAPTLRVIPMPADTNAYGDVFGGWLLSQMDLAGSSAATQMAKQRVVTVGIESMTFHNPVLVGDQVSFFTEIKRVGRTSVTVHIESWARSREAEDHHSRMVTEGLYSFVAIDQTRRPVPIQG